MSLFAAKPKLLSAQSRDHTKGPTSPRNFLVCRQLARPHIVNPFKLPDIFPSFPLYLCTRNNAPASYSNVETNCYCGSLNCRGVLGAKKSTASKRGGGARGLAAVSPWLLRLYCGAP